MSEVCCLYKMSSEQAKQIRKPRPNSGRKKMVLLTVIPDVGFVLLSFCSYKHLLFQAIDDNDKIIEEEEVDDLGEKNKETEEKLRPRSSAKMLRKKILPRIEEEK